MGRQKIQLIPCVACEAKISPEASSCPQCGHPGPKAGTREGSFVTREFSPKARLWAKIVIIVIILAWAVFVSINLREFMSYFQAMG